MAEPLSRALSQCGYVTPTPVQNAALPSQFEGRDLLALAETGSGKTAAFVLPLLQEFASNQAQPGQREVLALILAPTRELALQIEQEVASLARNMEIRRAVVLGGVSKGPQIHALKRGVHVLVATPGRLLDLVSERFCDLSSVRTLVLDEADRMFDMGFIRDIRRIASMLSHKRRTAMFSATMPAEIRTLAHELLKDPVRVDLSPKQVVVDRIDQKVMIVRASDKQSRLHTILADNACERVIVFTRTKRGADRVTARLGMAGIGAAAIHGNKAQNARQRALKDFSAGHVRVLVATDIAARGIDVSNITHVINFEMPIEPETYVHRIGRTARKGTSGIAISLCDPSEKGEIAAIERLMKQPIEIIGDVGGETLPAPERKPREHQNGRHEGRRNGGRSEGERSDRGHRASHRGDGKPRSDRGGRGAERSDDRRPHGERQHAERRPSEGATANAGSHRGDRGGRRDGQGGDRAHAHSGSGSSSAPGRSHGPRRDHAASNDQGHGQRPAHGHRHGGGDRPADKPAHEHRAGGRSHEERAARPKSGNDQARDNAPGRSSPQRWNGQQPPKFLNGAAPRRRSNSTPAA